MSNRGRQNVASFLVKDLGLDWRLGAEWFESQLLDHDVCSNYGNWNYAAGEHVCSLTNILINHTISQNTNDHLIQHFIVFVLKLRETTQHR